MGQTGSRDNDDDHMYYTTDERKTMKKEWTLDETREAKGQRIVCSDSAIRMVRDLTEGKINPEFSRLVAQIRQI
jgi:hypothetical protein